MLEHQLQELEVNHQKVEELEVRHKELEVKLEVTQQNVEKEILDLKAESKVEKNHRILVEKEMARLQDENYFNEK